MSEKQNPEIAKTVTMVIERTFFIALSNWRYWAMEAQAIPLGNGDYKGLLRGSKVSA
ncbi:MAG: hypothetical protein ABIK28_25560 [Planctomycetota bacterium]